MRELFITLVAIGGLSLGAFFSTPSEPVMSAPVILEADRFIFTSLAEIVEASDFVGVIRVDELLEVRQLGHGGMSGPLPYSVFSTTSIENWRGPSGVMNVGQIGGTIGGRTVLVRDEPALSIGEMYLAFLFVAEGGGGEFGLTGSAQGHHVLTGGVVTTSPEAQFPVKFDHVPIDVIRGLVACDC